MHPADPTVQILREWALLVPIIATAVVSVLNVILAILSRASVQTVKESLKAQDVVLASQNVTLATSAQKLDDIHATVNRNDSAAPVQVNVSVPEQSKPA